MALDHYLPATYLASFSSENTLPRRDRMLVVGDLQKGRSFRSKAGNIAAEQNFYTIPAKTGDPRIIDKVWGDYEAGFSNALEALIGGTIDAITWARVIIPFVAGILVRGPDFNQRFGFRLKGLRLSKGRENTNIARLLELQRLFAPVIAARWQVLAAQGEEDIITNDIGFVAFENMNSAELGISIPLTRHNVLTLIPRRARPIVIVKENNWYPIIEYSNLSPDDHNHLNSTLVANARRFIFGSNETAISSFFGNKYETRLVPEPGELGFISGPLAVLHEFTWHRLVSVLSKSPLSQDAWSFAFDWQAISNGWAPPIYFPDNLPEFPPSLKRDGDMITVSLYDVPGFTI